MLLLQKTGCQFKGAMKYVLPKLLMGPVYRCPNYFELIKVCVYLQVFVSLLQGVCVSSFFPAFYKVHVCVQVSPKLFTRCVCVHVFYKPFTRCVCPAFLSAFCKVCVHVSPQSFTRYMCVSTFFPSLLQGVSVQVFHQPLYMVYVCPGFLSAFYKV